MKQMALLLLRLGDWCLYLATFSAGLLVLDPAWWRARMIIALLCHAAIALVMINCSITFLCIDAQRSDRMAHFARSCASWAILFLAIQLFVRYSYWKSTVLVASFVVVYLGTQRAYQTLRPFFALIQDGPQREKMTHA